MRPYLCLNCKNWYIPLQMEEGDTCRSCELGLHAVPERTGVVDCHFGEATPTPSEIEMVEIDTRVARALMIAQDAVKKHSIGSLRDAEEALVEVEALVNQRIPEVIRWSAVKEMPGLVGEDPSMRFKSIEAIEELVSNNRRPRTDLELVRRSMKTCAEINSGIPTQLVEIRTTMNEARSKTTTPAPEKVPA